MTEKSPIVAFVPCRAGSNRVEHKNTRPFASCKDGLIELKLEQLSQCKEYARIVVSTDDSVVKEIAERKQKTSAVPVDIFDRPPELAVADTLDAFVAHIPDIIDEGVVAWTHVTSPFFGAAHMDEAARKYHEKIENGPHDSLMAVQTIRSFLWSETGCVSHDRSKVKWPQTQDLPKFYEVNSALFMYDVGLMQARQDRIGDAPYLFDTDPIAGFDIDWPEDFALAEKLFAAGVVDSR